MRTTFFGRVLVFLLIAATGWTFSGCGSNKPIVPKNNDRNQTLVHLGAVVAAFSGAQQELGRPPKSLKEITPYLPKGVTVDDLKSGRDNLPLVICWGADVQDMKWAKGEGVIAYEQKGDGEKRYVILQTGEASLCSPEQFKKLNFPPGHTPAQ